MSVLGLIRLMDSAIYLYEEVDSKDICSEPLCYVESISNKILWG